MLLWSRSGRFGVRKWGRFIFFPAILLSLADISVFVVLFSVCAVRGVLDELHLVAGEPPWAGHYSQDPERLQEGLHQPSTKQGLSSFLPSLSGPDTDVRINFWQLSPGSRSSGAKMATKFKEIKIFFIICLRAKSFVHALKAGCFSFRLEAHSGFLTKSTVILKQYLSLNFIQKLHTYFGLLWNRTWSIIPLRYGGGGRRGAYRRPPFFQSVKNLKKKFYPSS